MKHPYDEGEIAALCAGEIKPVDSADEQMLAFIGGARARPWPQKWLTCELCHGEWLSTAFPGKGDSWRWATICQPCADRWDAGLHPRAKAAQEFLKPKKPERIVRSPVKD